MRTNIDIDDKLMKAAMKASGKKTKRETVEEALRRLVDQSKPLKILELRGVGWDGYPIDAIRRDKSPGADYDLSPRKFQRLKRAVAKAKRPRANARKAK